MGAIALLAAPELVPEAREVLVRRMLAHAPTAGAEVDVRHAGGVSLGVCRAGWEALPELDGAARIALCGSWLVAADGRVLGGTEHAAAAQVAALLEAKGAGALAELHGDVAAVCCDVRGDIIGAVRSFTGRRDLVWARVGRGVAVATSPLSLFAIGVSREPDEEQLVLRASALEPRDQRTCFRDVAKVSAGQSLLGAADGSWREVGVWTPPVFSREGEGPWGDESQRDARLREALVEGMRACGAGVRASVFLSGGYDSTALFAAGRARGSSDETLAGISLDYPAGSDGDERGYIMPVAERWNADVRWAPLPNVADWYGVRLSAATPELEPCEHLLGFGFEALARVAAADGRQVAMDGGLGDLLFASLPVPLLAEAVERGAWRRAVQLRRDAGLGWRTGLTAIMPLLRRAPGAPLAVPSPYLRTSPVVTRAMERFHDLEPVRLPGVGAAQQQQSMQLTNPGQARLASQLHRILWRERVTLRAPLAHPVVLAACASAPAEDRWANGSAKVGLRRAMAGWIPEAVLAPRAVRTGVPSDLILNGLRDAVGQMESSAWDLMAPPAVGDGRRGLMEGRLNPGQTIVLASTLLCGSWIDGGRA